MSEEDCRKFGYHTGTDRRGEPVQIANYKDQKGRTVAKKVRGKDKSFSIVGNAKGMTLFGSHLWSNGKKVCLTEGEIDAISLSNASAKYAVVSLPNGAQSAIRAVKDSFDYLNGFEEIVICTDMDEAGRNAAHAIAEVLPVGKVKMATYRPKTLMKRWCRVRRKN